MVMERQEAELRQSKGVISIQDWYFRRLMEETTPTKAKKPIPNITTTQNVRQQGHGQIMHSSSSYFGSEYLVILICLTASILFLPLILPPLPPPPFMLLSLPICIFIVLMILAFSSSNTRGLTNYRYM
ncbi:hypothetical protein Leryth_009657 [Lithospermum erythrorhizon]|nr:hypothetical protein Leryth_009657 [Lithospermum erythrorhizon]